MKKFLTLQKVLLIYIFFQNGIGGGGYGGGGGGGVSLHSFQGGGGNSEYGDVGGLVNPWEHQHHINSSLHLSQKVFIHFRLEGKAFL